MTKSKSEREPYYYPDYIAEAFRRLGQASFSSGYPLLNRNIDVIHVLYNQSDDYPITEQTYSYVWWMLNNMAANGYDEWMKEYWCYACQYYMFTKEYSNEAADEEKRRFQEFHLMVGAMMVYLKRYDLLRHFMTYTSSLPAKFPLVPSTFISIDNWYKQLSRMNEHSLYLLKYKMKGMNDGALQERKIESLLLDYIALLLLRLHSVNDYNITYSNPTDLPQAGSTVEEAEKNILTAEVLKKRIGKWIDDKEALSELGYGKEAIDLAQSLLSEYQKACKQYQEQVANHTEISERKKASLKNDMLEALNRPGIRVPLYAGTDDERYGVTEYVAQQSVELDERMILAGRDPIGNNLGETLINALFTEMRLNYCYQFLLHGAIASFAIPYRDMEKALGRMELDNSYTILAMGISPHFFDEMDGFGRNDRNEITYRDIKVLEIASNESSFVIMKSRDIPTLSLRALKTEENLELLSEIDTNYHLYSNIDSLDTENLILKAKMGYQIRIAEPMKYVRLRLAYQLDSDKVVLNKVQPIRNYIV